MFLNKENRKNWWKKAWDPKQALIAQGLFFGCVFAYLEVIFHLFTFKEAGVFLLYPILFGFPIGFFLRGILGWLPEKLGKVLWWVLLSFAILVYMVETIFVYVFQIPFLLTGLGAGNLQVVTYYREIFRAIYHCLPALLLLALPLVVCKLLMKKGMEPWKFGIKCNILFLSLWIVTAVSSVVAVHLSDHEKSNIYDNYFDLHDTASALESFGVFTTLRLDLKAQILEKDVNLEDLEFEDVMGDDLLPEEDSSQAENQTPENDEVGNETPGEGEDIQETPQDPSGETSNKIDVSPNVLEIDFAQLAQEETDETIKKIHEYFASVSPTHKNEYTGMFEGYNLIHITAEAFSPYCVDETLTPTLYKLVNNGFVFQNFYIPPTGESTCGGEFMNMSGMLTNPARPSGTFTFQQTKNNYMPYALGNVFAREGVTSYAYHNNSLSYYNRIATIPNMGYEFKAALRGTVSEEVATENNLIFKIENPKAWPQSDLDMINATAPEYITKEGQFHAYYMTVSGHSNYAFSANSMAAKHKEKVADLAMSEACKAYIACNIDLDLALESLIRQLEEAGVLDKTVISLASDHFPYGLTEAEFNELAGKELNSAIDRHKSNLILWNNAMETPVIVEKVCSSIDVVPTLLNLFGIEYDSRLLSGRDILSDTRGFVWMTDNGSFLSGTIMYNSKTRKVTDLNGNLLEVSKDVIDKMKSKGQLMVTMNRLVIENDYYRLLQEYIEAN